MPEQLPFSPACPCPDYDALWRMLAITAHKLAIINARRYALANVASASKQPAA